MTTGIGLDEQTVLVASALVVTLTGILFIIDAFARKDDAVARIWSLAYISGVLTSFAYLASSSYEPIWWGIALGNGTIVFAVGAVWAGARSFNRRRSLLVIAGAAAAVVAVIALVQGKGGGVWAGGDAMIAGMAVFAVLTGVECFRGRMRGFRNARFLGAVVLIAGAFYVIRLIFYYAFGPHSEFFSTFLGTAISTLVMLMFVTGGAFSMVALRSEESTQILRHASAVDPVSGAVNLEQFTDRAVRMIGAQQASGGSIALVVADIDELATLNAAFGRAYGDEVLTRFVSVVRSAMPFGTPVCRATGDTFLFLLPRADGDAAARAAEDIRSALLEAALVRETPGVRVTASFGVATSTQCGYELDAMRSAADAALYRAKTAGRNRVVLSS